MSGRKGEDDTLDAQGAAVDATTPRCPHGCDIVYSTSRARAHLGVVGQIDGAADRGPVVGESLDSLLERRALGWSATTAGAARSSASRNGGRGRSRGGGAHSACTGEKRGGWRRGHHNTPPWRCPAAACGPPQGAGAPQRPADAASEEAARHGLWRGVERCRQTPRWRASTQGGAPRSACAQPFSMAGQIQLTVTTDTDDVHAVAIEAGATVGELCELLTIYTGAAADQQVLLFNGKPLSNRMERLDAAGVRNDDLLVLTRRTAAAAPRGAPSGHQNAMSLRPDGSAADPAAFQARECEHVRRCPRKLTLCVS